MVLQIGLGLLAFWGGIYKMLAFEELAKMPATAALPQIGWAALGAFEMLCGILLVVPAGRGKTPSLTAVAAAALAVESLALAGLDARYSLEVSAANPMVWVVLMALLAIAIAYGRYSWQPSA